MLGDGKDNPKGVLEDGSDVSVPYKLGWCIKANH